MPKVYGYIRVSTGKQDESNFESWILKKANELKIGPVEFIRETVSGKKDWKKRELGKLFEKLEKGDSIITFEYSRLGRNWMNSIEFLAGCDRKGVKVFPGNITIDADSMKSSVDLFITAVQSQTERENTSRRTKESLQRKKELGMTLGKEKGVMKLDKAGPGVFRNEKNEKDIYQLLNQDMKIKKIAEIYKVTPIVMGLYIKKWDLKNDPDKRNQTIINKSKEISNIAYNNYVKNQTLKRK
jgi:putative DNA-invertase from lambdoid prophage Rac